jgi:hypothetical protein
MENVGIFYDHFEYSTALWYILWPFGNLVVIRYIFPALVCLDHEKSGNPDLIGTNFCQKVFIATHANQFRHKTNRILKKNDLKPELPDFLVRNIPKTAKNTK